LKFGEISKSIEEHKKLTSDLHVSTSELGKILSNSQLRGGWGERAVQQIFTSVGLHSYILIKAYQTKPEDAK
jgi:DNA anti-recombination protein RmuC